MNAECRILHLQVRRFPFFDDFCKGKFYFVSIEREPSQFRTDSLFFEFGAAPYEGRADDADDDRAPVILNEEGCDDKKGSDSHHVNPRPITEMSFAANHERETQPNDGEGDDADENAEKIHSDQYPVISEK